MVEICLSNILKFVWENASIHWMELRVEFLLPSHHDID